MARIEYFHDSSAPAANSLTPTAFAAVRDDLGRLLLVRRIDSGNWELPGGRVELGESAARAAEREVAEEAGVTVKVTHLVGVYTDPGHLMAYPDTGEIRQQFAVCFHAMPIDGQPRPDRNETRAAAWVDPDQVGELAVHPSMRERIADAVSGPFDHSPVPHGLPGHTSRRSRPARSPAMLPRCQRSSPRGRRDIADRLHRLPVGTVGVARHPATSLTPPNLPPSAGPAPAPPASSHGTSAT